MRLASFKGGRIRPTSDRVREAIFNLIGQYTFGFRVLDLFAGTGALGIEALSRGAQRVLFVDNSSESLKLIRRNLALCGYESEGTVLKKDLTRGLPAIDGLGQGGGVDLVFADPPYRKGCILPILSELSVSSFLSSRATIVVEAGKEEHLPDTVGTISLAKTRVYGDTKICIYSYGGQET
jgi:16S rRNA (guanine966-N2)-methyltransferase